MLIESIRDAYREITRRIALTEPIVTVPAQQPAANSGNIAKSDMQARRHRRQRRMERVARHSIHGWTVRTW